MPYGSGDVPLNSDVWAAARKALNKRIREIQNPKGHPLMKISFPPSKEQKAFLEGLKEALKVVKEAEKKFDA